MKLGIGLIAFNRPEYFKQVVRSLEKQDLKDVDFYLFLDGQVNPFSGRIACRKIDLQKCELIYSSSKLPNKKYSINKENVGNAINQFEAIEYLSDNYEHFLIVEDDAVLGKDYLKLIRLMIKQLKRNDIFSYSCSFRRSCNSEDIDKNLNKVIIDSQHWFAECYYSMQWKKARPYFIEYFNLVKNLDYRQRPFRKIKEFFAGNGYPTPHTSQDAGRDYALFRAGLKRMTTVVNRGFYIGEKGMHFNPRLYEKYKFAEQIPYEFKNEIDKFDTIY